MWANTGRKRKLWGKEWSERLPKNSTFIIWYSHWSDRIAWSFLTRKHNVGSWDNTHCGPISVSSLPVTILELLVISLVTQSCTPPYAGLPTHSSAMSSVSSPPRLTCPLCFATLCLHSISFTQLRQSVVPWETWLCWQSRAKGGWGGWNL